MTIWHEHRAHVVTSIAANRCAKTGAMVAQTGNQEGQWYGGCICITFKMSTFAGHIL